MNKFFFLLLPLFSFAQTKAKDSSYWNHIKNEDRLRFIRRDITRKGKVVSLIQEADGDVHVWLKARNGKKILCEVICNERMPICAGYSKRVVLPKLGTGVTIVGDYCYDRRHKWYEIHPVKAIILDNPLSARVKQEPFDTLAYRSRFRHV